MYYNFYGFKEKPFNVTSDPHFLFMSNRHREAFAHLLYGIKEKKGFIEITGEIGTGKTTLCKALLNELDPNTHTAFILNSNLSEIQLLEMILLDLGIKPARRNKITMLRQLNDYLIDQLGKGHNVVVIIDEAQNFSIQMLEKIRMFSNLETEKEKLLQLILVGQPELRKKLNSAKLIQLKQRIWVRYHITPLNKEETFAYINHRLDISGCNRNVSFSDNAINVIFTYSGGTPRIINMICDKTLLAGYVKNTRYITEDIVNECIAEERSSCMLTEEENTVRS